VIARIWRARATRLGAAEYTRHFRSVVAPELQAIDGCKGSMLLQRGDADAIEVTVISWWASLDVLRSFAGEPVDSAVVHPDAARVLLDFDRTVSHHDVMAFGFPEKSQSVAP
jgi:heme-degrading monooxygenase HmoA